jgi:hypothetical protein
MTPARRFAYRLALALGKANPDAMLAQLPHRVFVEWIEYTKLEPFGEERADLRAGIIASTIANCLARKKGQPAFKVKDFMPNFEPPKQKTPDELFEQVQFLNFMFGGEYVDERMH